MAVCGRGYADATMRHGLRAVFLLGVAMYGCGVRYLPPPAVPQRVVPEVELQPEAPAEGEGRIVLDTVGEPARVGLTRSGYFRGALCITPCALNLPLGPHELTFVSRADPRRASTGVVAVGARPSVYQHALGERNDHTTARSVAVIAWSLSLLGLLTGGLLWGLFEAASDGEERGVATAGRTMVYGGAALAGVGAVFTILGRPVVQEGSGVQWVPSGAAPWRGPAQRDGTGTLPPPP